MMPERHPKEDKSVNAVVKYRKERKKDIILFIKRKLACSRYALPITSPYNGYGRTERSPEKGSLEK